MTATAPEPDELAPRRPRTALITAVVVGVVLAVLVGLLAFTDSGSRLAKSPLLGRQAPPLEGDSLVEGGSFDIADSGGQFTLVNFFATWCPPCIEEHPELVRFAETHARTGDARVVSVVLQDEPDEVAAFFEREGGDWPVLADPSGQYAAQWGVAAPPESYLVAPDGTVLLKIIGGVTADYLDEVLEEAKGGGAP